MSKREIIIQQAVDEQLHTLPFQKPFVDRPNSATIIMDAVMQIQRLEKQHKKGADADEALGFWSPITGAHSEGHLTIPAHPPWSIRKWDFLCLIFDGPS